MAVHPHRTDFRSVGPSLVLAAVLLAASCVESRAGQVNFLPDDAQIACRAILPQCFTRSGWAELCQSDPKIKSDHPDACRAAER
ncbi:MAG: hypothetical protein CMN95_08485 [Synechococcus sp. MED650]|nr:hypothetical protein [Synechococcus sp. MED650]OUW53452.1 MAG: hypothetical protein CBD48_06390 [Cyanobacteria bacterium TMED188]